jgi:hypothetical protein
MRRGPPWGQVSGRWYRAPRLNHRVQYAIFFGLAGAVAIGAMAMGRGHAAAADVLSAAPRGAWLLATVDVAALRPSPVAQVLVGSDGVTVPGVGRLAEACGFEPLAHTRQIALVAPEGEGDFGIAFAGDFDERALAACASKIVRARGAEPVIEKHGSYTLVGSGELRPDGGPPARHARLAYRKGGPYLVGRGAWLLTMIDAVDGRTERASPELLSLRDALSHPADTRGGTELPRSIVVAALLPRATRDQLKAEMEGDAAAPPSAAYAGVLAIDRAGLAVATGSPGSTTTFTAEMHCETAEACSAVKALLEQRRFAASTSPALRLLGLGGAIDSLVVDAHGPTLVAHAEAPTDVLARVVARIPALPR